MVLPQIQNVIRHRGGLLHRVHTRLQIGDVDFTVVIGDAVEVVGSILNLGNPEMDTAQPGAVRAGLNQTEGGLGCVGKHEIRIFIGIDLHHTDGIINEVPIRRFQLPDLICAGGQLTEVNLAVDVGSELLPVAAAHQLELKSDIGQGLHGHAIHLHQVDARLQGIKKDQFTRLRVAGLQFDLLRRGSNHMGVICGDFFHKIGAGLQIE